MCVFFCFFHIAEIFLLARLLSLAPATSGKAHANCLTRKVQEALINNVGGPGAGEDVSGGALSDAGGNSGCTDGDQSESSTILTLERKLREQRKKREQQQSRAPGRDSGGAAGAEPVADDDQGSADMAEMLPLRASGRKIAPCSTSSGDTKNMNINPRATSGAEEEKDEGDEGDEVDENPLFRGRENSPSNSEDFFDSFTSFWSDTSGRLNSNPPASTVTKESKTSVETILGRWSGAGNGGVGDRNSSMEVHMFICLAPCSPQGQRVGLMLTN